MFVEPGARLDRMQESTRNELIAMTLGLLPGALLQACLVVPPPSNSGEWAAWVQGVGSVAAVGMAGWVATIPLAHERRRRAEVRIAFASAVMQAVEAANDALIAHFASASLRMKPPRRKVRSDLDMEMLEKLLALPVTDWPNAQLYSTAAAFRMTIFVFVDRFEVRKKEDDDDPNQEAFWDLTEMLRKMIERRRREVYALALHSVGRDWQGPLIRQAAEAHTLKAEYAVFERELEEEYGLGID